MVSYDLWVLHVLDIFSVKFEAVINRLTSIAKELKFYILTFIGW